MLRKAARRRKALMRTGSIALALTVILGLAAACFMKARAKPSVEKTHFDLIPRDALAFATCRFSTLWPELVHDESVRFLCVRAEGDCRDHFGLPPNEIDQITWLQLEPDGQGVSLVTALNVVDEDEVATILAPDAQSRRHRHADYHLSPNGTAISFIEPKTYVFGAEPAIQSWLAHAEHPASSGRLDAIMGRAARNEDHLVAAVVMSEPLRRRLARFGPETGDLHTLTDFQDCTLIANFHSVFNYHFQANYSDADKALQAQQTIAATRDRVTGSLIESSPPKLMGPNILLRPLIGDRLRVSLLSLLGGIQFATEASALHIDGQARALDLLTIEGHRDKLPFVLAGLAVPLMPQHEPHPR
jgi:hypothetical protein